MTPPKRPAPKRRGNIVQRNHVGELIEDMGDENLFLATYADLVTLLFAFFVMLYGMSDTNVGKFDGAAESLRSALDGTRSKTKKKDPLIAELSGASGPVNAEEQVDALMKALSARVREDQVELLREGNRIRIRVRDHLLFSSGSADFSKQADALFSSFGDALKERENFQVRIEGHTDDRPIHTERFPSNWELSAIRATTVLRQLIGHGITPDRLTATGYGDLMPLVPNDSAEHRAKNRRVELVLEMEAQE